MSRVVIPVSTGDSSSMLPALAVLFALVLYFLLKSPREQLIDVTFVSFRYTSLWEQGADITILLSEGKFEPMVRCWRPGLHHCGLGHGGGHDTRPGISVLGPRSAEVSSVDAMGLHG